jgi:diacylglycerol kinase family enzyme
MPPAVGSLGILRSQQERVAMMKIGAVINATAGTLSPAAAEQRLQDIKKHLEPWVEPGWLAVVSGQQVAKEIERLKARGLEVLVIGGGDGSISTAAQLLADTGIGLAILALGTRNHFARDLGVPLEPAEAIGLLDRMQVHAIDLGEVNGHVFINNATLGPYPRLVAEREQTMQARGWQKWQANIAAVLRVLRRIRQMKLVVEDERGRIGYRTPFVFVGNNEYTGGILADTKRPSLSDGKLWFCTAQAAGRWALLRMVWQWGAGGIDRVEDLETRRLPAVTIHTRRRRVMVAIDGENQTMDTPLHFRIRSQSLRVIGP